MPLRVTLIVVVGLVCFACEDGPSKETFKGHLIDVPAGWETAREGNGPHQTLVLLPPEPTLACRLVIVRDSRRFGETDQRAFLATGRDRYGGGAERELSLVTIDGTLAGFAREGAELPHGWNVRPLTGTTNLEVYSEGRGTELVGMMIGWYDSDARWLEACRGAMRSLSR